MALRKGVERRKRLENDRRMVFGMAIATYLYTERSPDSARENFGFRAK
jgi:hypothetical protein